MQIESPALSAEILGVASLGATISFLLYRSTKSGSGLPGCRADGGGCGAVLRSRWSKWGSISVAQLGSMLYAVIAINAVLASRGMPSSLRAIGWCSLVAVFPLLIGAAVWFSVLQLFVLRRFCMFCMSVHVCGLVAACLIAAAIGLSHAENVGAPERSFLPLFGMGFLALGVLIVGQIVWIPPMHRVRLAASVRSEPGSASESNAGNTERSVPLAYTTPARPRSPAVSVFGGRVAVEIDRWPRLGPSNAERFYVYFFDYTCSVCRHLHALLKSVLAEQSDIAVLLIPVPGEGNCNPHIARRYAGHLHACAYGRLSLGVWLAAPERFEEYDAFLFDSDAPPSLRSAAERASTVIGTEAFDPAIADPVFDPWLQEGIALHHSLGLENTPALLLKNGVLEGQVTGVEALLDIIRKDTAAMPRGSMQLQTA